MKDKNYFRANVMMAVELEWEDGYRHWIDCKGSELKDTINNAIKYGDKYLSDIDFCTKQDDEWVKKVLNHAMLNWTKNLDWCKARGLTNLDDLIDYIIDNRLVA